MTKPDWIRLDRDALNQPLQGRLKGVQIEVRLSPFDIPEAVRGYFANPTRGLFTIEFRYPGGPEKLNVTAAGAVTAHVGRHSQRLHRLEVDVSQLEGGEHGLNLHLVPAIDLARQILVRSPERSGRHFNYEAVSRAVSQHVAELVPHGI